MRGQEKGRSIKEGGKGWIGLATRSARVGRGCGEEGDEAVKGRAVGRRGEKRRRGTGVGRKAE